MGVPLRVGDEATVGVPTGVVTLVSGKGVGTIEGVGTSIGILGDAFTNGATSTGVAVGAEIVGASPDGSRATGVGRGNVAIGVLATTDTFVGPGDGDSPAIWLLDASAGPIMPVANSADRSATVAAEDDKGTDANRSGTIVGTGGGETPACHPTGSSRQRDLSS